jgi:hypothetical protein
VEKKLQVSLIENQAIEQQASKNVHNCMNTNIYLGTSGGQNSNLYLNVVYFFNTSINLTSVPA